MCKYCESGKLAKDRAIKVGKTTAGFIGVSCNKNGMWFDDDTKPYLGIVIENANKDILFDTKIFINYCPKCGKNLKEEALNDFQNKRREA